MLTFKMMFMWFCTLVVILLISFLIASTFAGVIFKGTKCLEENISGIAWIITSILLSITCVMLAYS